MSPVLFVVWLCVTAVNAALYADQGKAISIFGVVFSGGMALYNLVRSVTDG